MATTRWRAAWGIGLLGLGACSGSPDKADAGEARDPVGLDDDAGAALDSGSRDEPADGDASSAPDAGSADDDSDATTGDPADASTDLDAASADLDAATTGSDAAAAPADAGALDAAADVDSRSAYCTGRGSPIKVPVGTGGEALCTGTIARQRFKNALCTCEGVDFKGYLNTGSFSASEDTTVVKAGGSVGVNGSLGLISAGDIDVGGSLRVYEASTYGGYVHAYGDLELNGWSSVAG
jgi:hypothetical protein